MVKGTAKPRSVKEEPSSMKAKEAQLMRHNSSSPARPPLSSFSASARNNLHTSPSSNPQSKRISQGKHLPRSISYPHLENTDSNTIGSSSSSNPSSPEKYSTPSGTPLKAKPKRTRPQNPSGVDDSDRPASNPGSSDEEATTTDYSSTSGSEAENSRHGNLRRMSLGPKIEAAVTKFNTPCKPLIPLAGRIGTPVASPGSLRAGVQRALVLDHSQPQLFDLEENVSFWDDHSVQVVIRTRPISGKEAASQEFSRCLRQDGPRAITWAGQPETRFTFDHVAGENISQEKLFKVVGLPIVENCMAGYNSCMFAYGQTGSGKTHTMLGDITSLGDRPSDNRGMTPRIFEYLFSKIQQEEQDRQPEQLRFVCKCSFLEIYNEQITDLLEPSSSNLQMREDSKKGVYVENLTEIVVSSVQDVVLLLLKGAASRKVASTNMNRESSRSHSVFTCTIESKWETDTLSNMRFGRLNLVDLAGSERQKSSRAEGDRLKEAASINKSLSTLGLVIMALVDIANGKPRHVPYRDSKLTFLLQDSLGGNSKTAIIATISPSSCCSMETLSTLKFAQRAKFIQNNAVINEDASGDVQALQREIQQLKEEVSRLRCQTISSIRRECRRDSNEFFRLSMTGKDLFDAAEKEPATEAGAELKSEELLGKIKALELVLAGALRREQEADNASKKLSDELEKADKLIEEREIEVRNCRSLLNLEENADPEHHLIFAEKLEIAGSLEYNSTVTKLELENQRLTEQLRSYQGFIDAGEKEMMAAEIQGLRNQVLELLDGKIAVERGSLSTTIAQDESHIMELETCRNDLTKCLEASSQLQSQVDELQLLVKQLSTQCAEKEKELDLMKTGWESAATKLFHNLVEGERALLEVGHEMDEILGEDWQPKQSPENAVRWSIDSVKSLKEVDVEHEYFKGRESSTMSDDMFSESKSRVSRRKRSSGINLRASFSVHEEKMKLLEASVARLEQELEGHKQLLLENADLKVEVEKLQEQKELLQAQISQFEKVNLDQAKDHRQQEKQFLEENAALALELEKLRAQLQEQTELLQAQISQFEKVKLDQVEDRRQQEKQLLQDNADLKVEVEKLQEQKELLQAQISQLEKVKLDQAEDHRQQEEQILEENAALKVEVEKLSAQVQEQTELLQAQISQLEKVKLDQAEDHKQREKQLLEENAALKVEVEKLCAQLQEQISDLVKLKLDPAVEASGVHEENLKLRHEINSLSQELKDHQQQENLLLEENADVKVEVEKLQEQNELLQSRTSDLEKVKSDQAEENRKLRHEIDALSQELKDGEKTLAALQDMARIKDEENALLSLQGDKDSTKISTLEVSLETQQEEMSELETEIERLEFSLHEAECRNQVLEEANQKTRREADMVNQKLALTDTVQEELRATVSSLHVELEKKVKQIQEMDHEVKSCQVKICELQALFAAERSENLQKTDGARRQIQDFQDVKSFEVEILSDVMQVIATEMRNEFESTLSLELEHEQALTERHRVESKRKENNLLAEILTLKEELLRTEYNVDVTREGELCLQGELLALSEIVKSINSEKDGVKKEMEALQLEHQSLVDSNEQSVETIALLNETVEDLQTQLQRKEDLLEGLEFDLSMLQEHAAEDTDFKQELLKADSRVSELELAVRRASEEVKAVNSCKIKLEEQLALKIAATALLEDRVATSETEATIATKEIQSLNMRLSRMQSSMSLLEADIAEQKEALISQEQEIAEAREVSSQKSVALLSLQCERDGLRSQCSALVEKVGCLQRQVSFQVSELENLHGELLVSKMSECCLQELKADLEAHSKETVACLELHIAELEGERDSMKSQLAQRSESESALQECASLSLDKMKCQVDDLRSLNCKLETELAVKIDAICSFEAQNGELRARVSAIEEERSDLVREFALKNDAMARDLDDMSVRIAALVSEKDRLETTLLQNDEAMAVMDVELESLKLKLSEIELQNESATKVLQDEIQALEKDVALKNDALSSMARELDEKTTTIASEKGTLLQRNEVVAAMDVELASLKSTLSELELQKMRDEEILQDEIQALKMNLVGSQESHNALKLHLSENIAALKNEFSSETNDEIQVMKAGIGALLKERDDLTCEVAYKSQLITALEAELEESTDCISGLEAKIAALQSDAQITELELGVIKVELTEAQNALKIIDKEVSEAKRVADGENSALNAQIVSLQVEKGALEVEISSKSALIMSLETKLEASQTELASSEAQILELQTKHTALEAELAEKSTSISELLAQEHDGIALEGELERANQEMGTLKAQLKQQEVQLSSLEELLARKAEALQHMVDRSVQATQECDGLRAEVESLKDTIQVKNIELEALEKEESSSEELALRRERDQALVQVQSLEAELRAAQALVASHKSSVLEAQKFAEVNILRASGKDEEARTLKASVSALKSQNNELKKELEASKHEAEKLRQSCEEFEMELQGMKNRMTMLQAVHSTGSRNFKGFQAAQAASLDLQKRLEDKETEVAQMYKRMTNLHNQNEAEASRLEEMETELAHVHQELDELQSQCEDKDAQLSALNGQLKEAETLTQDVMRDLHNVKLDISNYASLVSQQQLELIAERARHTDEAREKDEELSNLQTQLNQERQNWVVEMNHKQAEIVVARVLSEKMRLKNKTLAAEYKRLKADYGGKKKKLKFLEQQLTQITTETRRFSIGTESEADFDEVQQFQALLAQANDHERAQRKM